MAKQQIHGVIYLVIILYIIGLFLGFETLFTVLYGMAKMINIVLMKLMSTSLLNELLNPKLAYVFTGFVMTAFDLPTGKFGCIIGRVLNFVIGYMIGWFLI